MEFSKKITGSLKRTFHRTKESGGWLFYMKPQTYRVIYRITLKNRGHKTTGGMLYVPLPLTNAQQNTVEPPRFIPQNAAVEQEPLFNNHYATWPYQLGPEHEEVFEQFFSVRVTPLNALQVPSFDLREYSRTSGPLKTLYTTSNRYLEGQETKIKLLAREIKGHLTDGLSILHRLNQFVTKNLTYGNPIKELYTCSQALEGAPIDCGGFNAVLISLCIALGIPARMVAGFFAGYEKNDMHAWVEILLPSGQWYPADPSVENLFLKGRTYKSGRLGFVGSDRIALSVGCDIPIKVGNLTKKVPLLQMPMFFPEGDTAAEEESITLDTQFVTLRE